MSILIIDRLFKGKHVSIKSRAHYQALTDLVEVMSLASLTALLADVIWVIRDSIVGGFTIGMVIIAILLITALCAMAWAIVVYHQKEFKKALRNLMEAKFRHCKRTRRNV